ncbi:hypothetical protein BVJ53_06490 [Lacticaseibacillus chiayiensis]|uniref:Uncharacterized protein n=1 Tax=Lacticaseibacillus chiayiensis TaxID=2100821 RepID=A0A4Q1U329_9LACO|nr:hypothetical protein [Lacticaseibacillus chiayiensis]RXT25038.1 hypothetical protein BVJ53_06490 [Lacticaseibacillus chiayiensis]UYN55673.1 hypothetical protein OFW50_09255 [Lacticaseibacillus chiayiensis]
MKQIAKKFRRDVRYKFLSIAFMIVVFEHLFVRDYSGDAAIAFSHYLDRTTLIATLHNRYMTWTSRVFIEAVLLKLSQNMHVILWALIDILMWVLLIWAMMKLTNYKHNYLILCLTFIVPLSMMNGAGWMATSINYFWPLALGTLGLVSLYKVYLHENISIVFGLIVLAGLVFATNFETYSVMYLILLSYFSFLMIRQHRFSVSGIAFIAIQYSICLANIIIALVAPGNKQRVVVETKFHMLDFANMTFFDKLSVGFNHTFSELTDHNVLFLIFAIMLVFVALSTKPRSRELVGISVIPLIFVMFRTFLSPLVKAYTPEFKALFDAVSKQYRVDSITYFDFVSYLPFVIYALILIAILLVLINGFKSLDTGVSLSVALLSGLVTVVAIGFSPSMYASGSRIFFFLDFILIYAITVMYDETSFFLNDHVAVKKALKICLFAFTVFSVVNNLIAIGATYFYGNISF